MYHHYLYVIQNMFYIHAKKMYRYYYIDTMPNCGCNSKQVMKCTRKRNCSNWNDELGCQCYLKRQTNIRLTAGVHTKQTPTIRSIQSSPKINNTALRKIHNAASKTQKRYETKKATNSNSNKTKKQTKTKSTRTPNSVSKPTYFNKFDNWIFFKQPIQKWLIQQQDTKKEIMLPNGFDKKINLKFTWSDSLDDLYQKGITKIVLLGGANLISAFLLEDLIDELQITITPQLLGGDYCWVSSELRNLNTIMNKKNNWILKESKKLGNNELLIRYFRNN